MENRNSPNKILKEKQIFIGNNNRLLQWKDIKDLQLEDDDIIHSGWVDDEGFDHHGYYHVGIMRMVEETDEEFEKRIERNKRYAEEMKRKRYENYLKLKEEFENGKSK